jgi:uncharacterized membrane-anchored protein YjiN (DUF445 family)
MQWVARPAGSKMNTTRALQQLPSRGWFPARSNSCPRPLLRSGSAWRRVGGWTPFRSRRSLPEGWRSCGRRGAAQALLDQGLDFIETTLARNKATIVRQVSKQSSRWIPKWFDNMVAAKVILGLEGTLQEMREPDHPWRAQANALIEKLIDDLAHDPEMRAQGEALKQEILAHPVFVRQAQALWDELKASLKGDLPHHAEAIAAWAAATLSALGYWLEEDEARRARINRSLRLLVLRTVLPRRAEIGAYFAEVVDSWDAASLVSRLELQVGKDLQYIRINGTLVGGLVGLTIFTLSRAFGG